MGKRLTTFERMTRARAEARMKARRAEERQLNREERERTKGRKSLRGLDRIGFYAALDAIAEGRVTQPLFAMRQFEVPRVKSIRSRGEPLHPTSPLEWVRIIQAPPDILTTIAERFTFRVIVSTQWHRECAADSPGFRDVRRHVLYPVFRVADAVMIFAAIWPDVPGHVDNWKEFARRYFYLYTDKAVDENQREEHLIHKTPADRQDPFGLSKLSGCIDGRSNYG